MEFKNAILGGTSGVLRGFIDGNAPAPRGLNGICEYHEAYFDAVYVVVEGKVGRRWR